MGSFTNRMMDIYESIKKHLQSYPNHVPATLHNLDELRFSDIPATLAKRKSDGDAYLEKSEVVSLVQWKLCVKLNDIHIIAYVH